MQNLIWRGDICLWWHCKEGSEHCTHHDRLEPSNETNLKTCRKASTTKNKRTKGTSYTRILETREPAWISCWQPANPVTSMQTHWNQAWTRRGGIVYAVLSRYTYCICTAIKVQKILFALLSRYKKWNWPWEAKTLWVQSFAHLPIWWGGWSGMQLLITFQWHKKTLQIKLTIWQLTVIKVIKVIAIEVIQGAYCWVTVTLGWLKSGWWLDLLHLCHLMWLDDW